MSESVSKAIDICKSQSALARACGVSQPTVNLWLNGGKMDVKYIPPILQATNFEVNPTELRPDVDWAVIYEGLKKVFEKKAKAL
ncbi:MULTISPECIES: helix-turn-helix domain-containing protein [unclassified Pasteurella]|uniref:helix-turn-helix domain-containing protein n=1 Tax=unclassified Pasteurella TaxID=2621516 RepID=UPI00107410F9|nr:helix-turn-helix domain-containing protein [Pasteurella sp. 19428wF3_WM03]TFU50659.1 helix-turn-helix domain-containing protein [Pasteurella sp. WM03]